ncbi:unnamed protein product [Diplocarpon coronariae]|uniref:Uncharacterized protein n=1 Tax=Diplocarpon coronariae TaxID=2795749 RepID=A0A218YUU2_9HELO|nr:hypothetical protein B2J93_3878 [Marssonina coronariae]
MARSYMRKAKPRTEIRSTAQTEPSKQATCTSISTSTSPPQPSFRRPRPSLEPFIFDHHLINGLVPNRDRGVVDIFCTLARARAVTVPHAQPASVARTVRRGDGQVRALDLGAARAAGTGRGESQTGRGEEEEEEEEEEESRAGGMQMCSRDKGRAREVVMLRWWRLRG